jgi:hypothetical protein
MVAIPYIKLNGEKYELDTDPDVTAYQELPQEIWQAPAQVGFWQSWVMRSWHGGERVTRILTAEDLDKFTYHDGEGVDVSTWGEISLQPACARSLTVSSATLPMCTTNDGSAVLVGHVVTSAKYLNRFTGNPGSWTGITTPNAGAVTDIITGKGQNMYGVQLNRVIESTDNGATWANSTKGRVATGTATAGGATTITLAVGSSAVDDYYNGMQIYITSGQGVGQLRTITDYVGSTRVATVATWSSNPNNTSVYDILSAATPTDMVALAFCANELYALGPLSLKHWDGSAWQTDATWGGTCMCTYGEEVYWAQDTRVFRWNGTSSYEVDAMPNGFTITGLFPYRNLLVLTGYYLVQGGKKGSIYYMLDGRDAHLYNVGSYDGSSDYTINAMAGGDDEIYLANQKRGGADRYDLTKGGLSCGPAWAAKGVIPFKSMAFHNGKLLIGRYDGVGGTDGVYVSNVTIPTAFVASGWVTTPEMDFLFPVSKKLFNTIQVLTRSLAVSERVKMEYSLDGGTTYSVAGYVEGTGVTGKEFRITNANGSTVKLRITLEGPGTSTPKVVLVRVDAQPVGEPLYYWALSLALYSVRGGRNAILELRKAYKSRSVLNFEDVYGESHSVIIDQQASKIPIGDRWTAKVQVRLKEV